MADRFLPFVLSVIAGATDIIGVLGLNGLFTAHITGNLVLLAARTVAGAPVYDFVYPVGPGLHAGTAPGRWDRARDRANRRFEPSASTAVATAGTDAFLLC